MVAFDDSNSPPLAHQYSKIRDQCKQIECEFEYESKFKLELKQKQQDVEDEMFENLPLIDLSGLASGAEEERAQCGADIVCAASEWGFFQVINHGVSPKLIAQMRKEQIKLFDTSFSWKSTCGLLNNSYRWGTPTASSPGQFSWSEAFHMPLDKVSDPACYGQFSCLRQVVMEYAEAMQKLTKLLAGVLITNLGQTIEGFEEQTGCDERTCFLRLNHYPKCPLMLQEKIYGLVPHTDSDFMTILDQDQVGGLHLIKDNKWAAVKPIQDALIVNIGDLFQAWSNDLYKSVEHKVMGNAKMDRFSVAYFLCPSYDSVIESCRNPSVYKSFTFGQYRRQVQEDSRTLGRKVGLSRFQR